MSAGDIAGQDLTRRLDGRVALVTGAASGNGLAIAGRLLAEGASVVFADMNAELLGAQTPEVPEAALFVGDVARAVDAAGMVDTALSRFGRLDIVVNNAGIVRFSEFSDLEVQEWDEVMRVNATGAFLVAKAAASSLVEAAAEDGRTSAIVNITSTEGHVVIASGGHPQVHYNASKGALHMLNQALAIELASSDVRVNAVAPGIVETPFTRRAMSDQRLMEYYLARIPLGRVAQPADVAAATAFLASEDARSITGTTIFVDGGWTAQ